MKYTAKFFVIIRVLKVVLKNFSFQDFECPLVTERVAIGDVYSLYGTLESSDYEK